MTSKWRLQTAPAANPAEILVNTAMASATEASARSSTLGYKKVGEADGEAGPLFDAAVKDFQRDNDCVDDGELTAGNKTWRCILGME